MAHSPRHSGGFSQGQSVIGSPQSSVNQGPPGSGPGSQGYVNPNQQAAQSMISQGITSLSGTTGGSQGQQAAQQQQQQGFQTIQQAAQQANQQAAQQKKEEEARIEEELEKSKQQQVLDLLFGSDSDPNFKKKSAFEKEGKHPLRAQLDYLIAKYGEDVVNTEQGKVLMGYLAGVPVERGGGLGAQDENYGLTGDEAKEFQSKLLLDEDFMDGQNYRNSLLRQVAGMTNTMGGQFDFSNIDPERASQGLSPEQYYNFRQQLMAADATPENQAYKDAFPGSSGAGLGAILEKVMPGSTAISAITGGILPERNMVGYQGTNDPFAATFKALPQSQDRASGIMTASSAPVVPPVVPPTTPDVPPVVPPVVPPTTSAFDLAKFYASLPQYTQQGVMSPSLMQYYRNLGLFPRA